MAVEGFECFLGVGDRFSWLSHHLGSLFDRPGIGNGGTYAGTKIEYRTLMDGFSSERSGSGLQFRPDPSPKPTWLGRAPHAGEGR
ncbi:MAG: hypothetical protein DWQ01_06630 [Planctomycetota bacterium]|nr:MAG: hypothetical protein DWQ01_06630 [Planctomycetota bacterium]